MQLVATPLQSPMQAAFAPWIEVEKWLRKATEHDLPISINGLWGLEEVKKVCRDSQQIRDIIQTFQAKGMVTKHDLTPEQRTGDKRDRIGYKWDANFKGEAYRPSARIVARQDKKPSKGTTTKPTQTVIRADKALLSETPKAVELVFQGVTLTVSRNPENGNTRLVIEG